MINYFLSNVNAVKKILIFILLATLIGGCKSDEPYVYVCKDGHIEIQEVTNLRRFQGTVKPADSLATLVIRTEKQYKININDRVANIDFSRKTLLGGRLRTSMGGHVVTQSVTSSCSSNNLVYEVQIKVSTEGATAHTETPFFVTIPKIPESTNVTFHVHF